MSDVIPTAPTDPYDAVLADLRAKRDEIERVIQTLESFRAGIPVGSAPRAPMADSSPVSGPGAFLGLTIVDAAKKELSNQRRPLGNAHLVSAFRAGGMVLTSTDPINTVSSIMTRRFNQVGDIVRVGRGMWGLAEWYPNRSFRKKAAKDDVAEPTQEDIDAAGAIVAAMPG